MQTSFDLIVVGAGSGGYAAARTARELGATVALVDRGPLGGLCILRGCMPSKTLIATSDAAYEIDHAHELGIRASRAAVDFPFVMARKKEIIGGFTDYRNAALETFPIFRGEATFESPDTLRVGDVVLRGGAFVIGTGSVVAPPVIPGLAAAGFIDSDAALELAAPPKSMIVLGGGYVSTELGQFFSRTGTAVTVVIRGTQLLSGEDTDIGEALTEYLREDGMTIETRAQVQRVSVRADGAKVVHYVRDGREAEVAAEEIFYALGRVPNIAGLGLEKAGVRAHVIRGIEVDQTMRTSNRNIFAVGDVTGQFLLVHVAIQQGEVAARNAIRAADERIDYSLSKAHTVFSDPQVAVAGESEKELLATGVAYVKASYPFSDLGKAISIGKTKGFVKMLAAPLDGKILGVAILGAHASDLIHIPLAAMAFNATVFDYLKIPHLHPTMAEILTYPAEELAETVGAASALAVAH
ncbi:MAG: FAD-dependent oxidoreductase [Candidatus Velthaea sp.]|jgi:pyruvate/2-oxoglutarate dehydrogenase complex dihydrolipoamide dehydrogenase (E3) component